MYYIFVSHKVNETSSIICQCIHAIYISKAEMLPISFMSFPAYLTLKHHFNHNSMPVCYLLKCMWLSGQCYMGHDSRVTSVHFSHDRKSLLSSSGDGTVRVWRTGTGVDCGETAATADVVISHTRHQPSNHSLLTTSAPSTSSTTRGSGSGSNAYSSSIVSSFQPSTNTTETTRNRPFGAEINVAQFYYMDKFVLLVSLERLSYIFS